MKKLITASLLLLLFASPVHAQDLKSQLVERVQAFNSAYEKGDFDAVGQFYLEDAVAYPQGSDIVKGREAIQALWQSVAQDMKDVSYKTFEVLEAGDYALQYYQYDATYQGQPDQGRVLTVWKKEGGDWKIARDMWYSNPMQ